MEGMIMDSERFDRIARSLGQTRSRRQTLRGLAGAGALLTLLAAKPVAAGKTGKPNKPNNSKPGKGQPGNSPPGGGQNGGGLLGSPGPSTCAGANVCDEIGCGDGEYACICATTVGRAGFCAYGQAVCKPCSNDADCKNEPGFPTCIQAPCCSPYGSETACMGACPNA
jgi:hypothetical protein